ncbi:MAG: MFS transporter [Gemmatimonadetes bacterium]|nr:MFS transporter [Gemmatimonadota bacterium]
MPECPAAPLHPVPPRSARSRFGVLFLTVFIDLAGFGLILPILPYYAQRLGAGGVGFGALVGIYSAMQFLATQILGRLSDRVGRRPVLLATITVSAVGYTMFGLAGTYGVLFLARMISGFSGGNISVAQAYIADVTAPSERSRGMGFIGAAFGLGFIVGPALGGLAGHYGGPSAPAWVAVTLCIANLISAYFILPESLPVSGRSHRPLLDLGHLRRAVMQPHLRSLMVFFGVMPLAFAGYTVALPLYAGRTFGWRERELGWFFTIVGFIAALVQGYLFGRIVKRVGDRTLVILGALGMAVSIGAVPFLQTTMALYAWTVVLAFSNSIASPAATGLISRLSGAQEQGTMLGAAQAVSALGRLTGPVVIGQVYDGIGARSAFFAAAAVMGAAWVAATRVAPLPDLAAHQPTPSASDS